MENTNKKLGHKQALEHFLLPEDHQLFQDELASFLPDRIFDAHAHLCHPDFYQTTTEDLPKNFGSKEYFHWIKCLHGDKTVKAFFLTFVWPYSHDTNLTIANQWTADNTNLSDNTYGAYYFRPSDDPEFIRQEVKRLKLQGLKCYYITAPIKDKFNADIPDYLPEPVVKVANEQGWSITLHLVKKKAVADPGNIFWIRKYCKKYPNIKLILAHSARGFQPSNNLQGLKELTDLPNLYFDTSANCSAFAHQVVIKLFGHKKLLYGTDAPISMARGTTFPLGDGFIWFDTRAHKEILEQSKSIAGKPVLLGLEHLRSLKWATWAMSLSDSQIEDIFYNNAAELFQN